MAELSFEEITFKVTNEVADFLREMAADDDMTVDEFLRLQVEFARGMMSKSKSRKKDSPLAPVFPLKSEGSPYT